MTRNRGVALTETAHTHLPNLKTFARALDRVQAFGLLSAGVMLAVRPRPPHDQHAPLPSPNSSFDVGRSMNFDEAEPDGLPDDEETGRRPIFERRPADLRRVVATDPTLRP